MKRKVERLGGGWSNLPRELQREMDEVRELYEQAADQGHEVAMNNLGAMYGHGHGVAQSYVKARDWTVRVWWRDWRLDRASPGNGRRAVEHYQERKLGLAGK